MLDRVPTKPNRYAVYDDTHNFIRYEYHERADEPTEAGDPLNKANLLPDTVATALGLDPANDPQVKDALEAINSSFVDARKYWWDKYAVVYIENVGALTSGVLVIEATASLHWKTYYTGINVNTATGEITGVGHMSVDELNSSTGKSSFNGKYFQSGSTTDWYKGSGSTTVTSSGGVYTHKISAYPITATPSRGIYVEQVPSYDVGEYPVDGVQDGYYYAYKGRANILPARIASGSYTGTGTYGDGNPNSLTFGFVPKLLYITARSSTKVYSSFNTYSLLLDYTAAIANTGTKKYMYTLSKGSDAGNIYSLSNSNRTLSWFSTNSPENQLNSDVYTYHYVAIG